MPINFDSTGSSDAIAVAVVGSGPTGLMIANLLGTEIKTRADKVLG